MELANKTLYYQKVVHCLFNAIDGLLKCENDDCCNITALKCHIKQIFADMTENNGMNLTNLKEYLKKQCESIDTLNTLNIREMCKCDEVMDKYNYFILPNIVAILEMFKTSLFLFYSPTDIRNTMIDMNKENEHHYDNIDLLIYDVLSDNIDIISAIDLLESYCRSNNLIIIDNSKIKYSNVENITYCQEEVDQKKIDQEKIDKLVIADDGVEIYVLRTMYFRMMLQSILFVFYFQNNINNQSLILILNMPDINDKDTSVTMNIVKYLHEKYGKNIWLKKLDE